MFVMWFLACFEDYLAIQMMLKLNEALQEFDE